MNKLNDLLEKIAKPLKSYSSYLLRIGLGISFFFMAMEKFQFNKDLLIGSHQKAYLLLT